MPCPKPCPKPRPKPRKKSYDTVLFQSRLDAGEDLCFRSPLGRPEPADTTFLVASDGAIEVAWPWAYLRGIPVYHVDPGALPAASADLRGRLVSVLDDGLLDADTIVHLLQFAGRSGARRVALAAPAVTSLVRRVVRKAVPGLGQFLTLRPSTHADRAACFYPQQAVAPGVARLLLSEVQPAQPLSGPPPGPPPRPRKCQHSAPPQCHQGRLA